MKRLFLHLVFLFTAALSIAQDTIPLKEFGKSALVLISRKSAMSSYPILFEETDSLFTVEGKKDTVVTEYFSIYSNRINKTGRGKRKTIYKNGEIKVEVNDTLVTHINRKKNEFEGMMGGEKGLIVKRFLPSSSDLIPATEQYILKKDSSYFLLYRPEISLIELEISPSFQRNRLLGTLFNEVCKSESGTTQYERFNRKLQLGDTLQVLFRNRTLNPRKNILEFSDSQLLTIGINNITVGDDITEIEYFSSMIDIRKGTKYNTYLGKLQYYPDAIALDNYTYIKDELYERNLQILPSSTPIRPHPYYPLIDLAGAQIEASWQGHIAVGDTAFSKTSYWNSVNDSKLNYLPAFPIAWRDEGDSFIGNPNFIKVNGITKGELYEVKENNDLHFSSIVQTRDSIFIYISSPSKVNIALDFKEYDKEKVIKKSHGLSKGTHLIAVSKQAFRIDYAADLILYELEGQKKVLKQSFRYTEQQNL